MDGLKGAIEKLSRGEHLSRDEARRAALEMLAGEVPDAVIGGLLVALKTRGSAPRRSRASQKACARSR